MSIKKLISLSIGRIAAGYQTDEAAVKSDRVRELIILGRPIIIKEMFDKDFKKVHPDWSQSFFPIYDEKKQESPNYTVYDVPMNILLSTTQNSIRFVGSADCQEQFRVVYSPGEMSNLFKNEITKASFKTKVYVMYNNHQLQVWNRNHIRIKDVRVDAIFKNPFDVPTWNQDLDDFPIDSFGAEKLIEYVFKNYMVDVLRTPANVISNSQEDSQVPQNKK